MSDDDSNIPLDPADVATLRQMLRWIRNLNVEGVPFHNTPDGASMSIRIPPPPRIQIPKPFRLLYGTLVSLWVSGQNVVYLTPCKSGLDGTTLLDGSGSPLPNVLCYVSFPLHLSATCLGATTGDILAYFDIGACSVDASMAGKFMLFMPPQLPRPTAVYQGVFNQGGSTITPEYVAAYMPGHP